MGNPKYPNNIQIIMGNPNNILSKKLTQNPPKNPFKKSLKNHKKIENKLVIKSVCTFKLNLI